MRSLAEKKKGGKRKETKWRKLEEGRHCVFIRSLTVRSNSSRCSFFFFSFIREDRDGFSRLSRGKRIETSPDKQVQRSKFECLVQEK